MTNTPFQSGAALFDIDGTLVDSNYFHVETWLRAFGDLDLNVDGWRIHRCIGMDSKKLLSELLGDDAERLGDEAKELHTKYYTEASSRLRPFKGARELLRELDGRGAKVVLTTSAPADELETLRTVLDIEDAVTEVTSAEDVTTAKPEPDIVESALRKGGVAASNAVMIGDTVWDVIAAKGAGVPTIGVLSGGVSAGELLQAGAVAVYDDVAQLLERLDESPLAVLYRSVSRQS